MNTEQCKDDFTPDLKKIEKSQISICDWGSNWDENCKWEREKERRRDRVRERKREKERRRDIVRERVRDREIENERYNGIGLVVEYRLGIISYGTALCRDSAKVWEGILQNLGAWN